MPKRGKRQNRRKRARRTDRVVLLSLIFAFPLGLFLMWSERCAWPRSLKTGVSVGLSVVLIAVLAPFTQPPSAPKSGVRIVSNTTATEQEMVGPKPDEDFDKIEIYVPHDESTYTIVAAPTEAPPVIYVYCNDMGEYYHTETCRYTKLTTPKVPLTQAINAGYKRCTDCDAPTEPVVE